MLIIKLNYFSARFYILVDCIQRRRDNSRSSERNVTNREVFAHFVTQELCAEDLLDIIEIFSFCS